MSALDKSYELLFETDDETGTARLGKALAESAVAGGVLLLTGGLGAGKTTLIKYLAGALAIDPSDVRSPTFTLVHEYRDGTLPLVHMDVYRLPDPSEFESIGGFEYLDTNRGVVAIEWGEQVMDELDPDWLQLKLEHHVGTQSRSFWGRSVGPVATAWLQRLRSRLKRERQE